MKSLNLNSIIRVHNLKKLFIPVCLSIICAILALSGPAEKNLKAATVSSLSDINSLYESKNTYVQINADRLFYTGTDYVVKNSPVAKIYYCIQDEKCYFFIISSKELPKDYETLDNYTVNAYLTTDNNLYSHIVADMSRKLNFSIDGTMEVCNDIIISQYNTIHSFSKIYNIALLCVCLILAIHIIYIIFISIYPSLSRYVLALRRYGNRNALYALAQEQLSHNPMEFEKGLYMTDDFIIKTESSYISIIPIENIVWVYNYNDLRHHGKKVSVKLPMCIVTDIRKIYKIPHVPVSCYKKIISMLLNKHPEIMVGYEK